jgi:hypothetical protein
MLRMENEIIPRIEGHILVMLGGIVSLIIVSLFLTASADSINPGLYSVDSKPYGLTFPQWSEKWWQWMISIPQSQNPLNDDTGKNCGVGQNNSNVWFMTGTGSGTVVRSCTVPSSKAILIQPAETECSYAEYPSLKAESELRSCAIEGDKVSSIHVSIDGKNLQNPQNYIVQTPLFDVSIPKDNIFAAPAGPSKAVSHAYVIFLEPLKAGKHDIHFDQVTLGSPETGTGNFAYDVTYHLTVK